MRAPPRRHLPSRSLRRRAAVERAPRRHRCRTTSRAAEKSVAEFEGGDEGLLRDFDAADLLHAFLAGLLLLEQLALARDVTAVTLRDDVLAFRLHCLAGDDPASDRRLDRPVEQLARDQLAQLLGHALAVVVRLVAMRDRRERVDRRAVEHDVDLHELRLAVP